MRLACAVISLAVALVVAPRVEAQAPEPAPLDEEPGVDAGPSDEPSFDEATPDEESALDDVGSDDEPPSDEPEVDPFTGAIEEFSLEDLGVVLSATQSTVSLAQAPSVVQIITARDIRRRGYRTVADALRHVPGLHVIDDHVYQSVGVRGVFAAPNGANDTLRVMINGQPVHFRPTGVAFLAEDLIPVEAIERIEILRGPASALYGANAFLGVINIITFDGSDDEHGSHAAHSIALDGYLLQNPNTTTGGGRASFFSSTQAGPVRYMLTGIVHYGDRSGLAVPGLDDLVRDQPFLDDPGRFPPPRRYPSPGWDSFARAYMLRNPVSVNDTDFAMSAYSLVTWDITKEVQLRLDGHLQYSDRGAEWQSFTFLTHQSRLTHLNGFGRLSLAYRETATEGLSLRASMAISGGTPTSNERIVDRLIPGSYRRRNFNNRALDLTAAVRWSFGPFDSLTLGADYTHDIENLLSTEIVSPTSTSHSGDFDDLTFLNVGLFGQWMWNIAEPLTLTVGLRLDHNSEIACNSAEWDCIGERSSTTRRASLTDEDVVIDGRGLFQLSSRAGLVYQLPIFGMYAKLIYGSSFRPPSPYQLYHQPITTEGADAGSPAIQPQTADTVEVEVGLRHKGVSASLVGFVTLLQNLVIYVEERRALAPRNASGEFAGLEGEVRYESGDVASAFLTFDWLFYSAVSPQRGRGETDEAWANSPLNATTGSERYPDWTLRAGGNLAFEEQHLNINTAIVVVGQRRASLVNNQLYARSIESTYTLDPYVVLDLTVSTLGLEFFPERETVFSLSFRSAPGSSVETGVSGIDIPTLGTRVMLRMQQAL